MPVGIPGKVRLQLCRILRDVIGQSTLHDPGGHQTLKATKIGSSQDRITKDSRVKDVAVGYFPPCGEHGLGKDGDMGFVQSVLVGKHGKVAVVVIPGDERPLTCFWILIKKIIVGFDFAAMTQGLQGQVIADSGPIHMLVNPIRKGSVRFVPRAPQKPLECFQGFLIA